MSETSAHIRRHASGRQTGGPGECVFNPMVKDASRAARHKSCMNLKAACAYAALQEPEGRHG